MDVAAWQKGGNTILGTVMLFVPIAVAAGITPVKEEFVFDFSKMRKNIDLVLNQPQLGIQFTFTKQSTLPIPADLVVRQTSM